MKKILIIVLLSISMPTFANSLISLVPSLAYKCEKDSLHCQETLEAINELEATLNDATLLDKLTDLKDAVESRQDIKDAANSFLRESLKPKRK